MTLRVCRTPETNPVIHATEFRASHALFQLHRDPAGALRPGLRMRLERLPQLLGQELPERLRLHDLHCRPPGEEVMGHFELAPGPEAHDQ